LSMDLKSAYLHDPFARQHHELAVFVDRARHQRAVTPFRTP
jgi:hypothetical protein